MTSEKRRVLYGMLYSLFAFLIIISPVSFGGPSTTSDIILRALILVLPSCFYFLDGRSYFPAINDIRIVLIKEDSLGGKVLAQAKQFEFPVDVLSVVKTYKYKYDTKETLKRTTRKITDFAKQHNITLTHIRTKTGLRINSYIFHPEDREIERKGVTHYEPPKLKALEILAEELKRPLGGTDDIGFSLVPGSSNIKFTKASANQNTAGLGNVLSSSHFSNIVEVNKHGQILNLPIGVGVDIDGFPVTIDLKEGPMWRMTGSTGSGKSVAATTILSSLISSFTPEQLEIHIIDLKKVDFTSFEQFPHVKTLALDAEDSLGVLAETKNEIDRRFLFLKEQGYKNMVDYNRHIKDPSDFLPHYYVFVDEYSELLGVGTKEQQTAITNEMVGITQLGRAAGIVLILASQRLDSGITNPRVRTNTPSVFGLKTTTWQDSRVAVGRKSCEDLLGDGDCYLAHKDAFRRFQFCYVSDKEIDGLAKLWKEYSDI